MTNLILKSAPIIAVILVIVSCNPHWTTIDRIQFHKLKKYNLNNAQEVEAFYLTKKYNQDEAKWDADSLGFGLVYNELGAGGGYVGMKCQFLYLQDSIVSYKLTPEPQYKPILIKKYNRWYSHHFKIENNKPLPKYRDTLTFYSPLESYPKQINLDTVDHEILYYMSPFSGTHFEDLNEKSEIHFLSYNRKLFNKIEPKLNSEILRLLFYSKNPVSRLTSIEYYLRNKSRFPELVSEKLWVKRILGDGIRVWYHNCQSELYNGTVGCSNQKKYPGEMLCFKNIN